MVKLIVTSCVVSVFLFVVGFIVGTDLGIQLERNQQRFAHLVSCLKVPL